MRVKGLQNWMGVVSLVLLILAIVSLFLNWTLFEEGDEPLPEDWEDLMASEDPEDILMQESVGLLRLLSNIAAKGLSPFAVSIMLLIMVRTVVPVGEEALYMGIIWVIIVLFIVLFALLVKLLIQRIIGKKAKGILALVLYGVVGAFSAGIGAGAFYGIITPWGFVGFAAMLGSIILWTVYCRKVGITYTRSAPAIAAPYNYMPAPQIPPQGAAPYNYMPAPQIPPQGAAPYNYMPAPQIPPQGTAPYNYAPAPQISPQSVAPTMTSCGQCGAQLQWGTVFCGRCGAKQSQMQ